MTIKKKLQHKFVEFIPDELEEELLYISIPYKTAVHLCVCGCMNKVVTPLSPNDWSLTFNGREVSLYPSIGNWSFPCQTHYFVTQNRIELMNKWNKRKIKAAQDYEALRKREYYDTVKNKSEGDS